MINSEGEGRKIGAPSGRSLWRPSRTRNLPNC